MKILKLPPYFYPEQVSSSHLTQDLYEAYKEAGIYTEVFVPFPTRGIDEETRKKYMSIPEEMMYDDSVIVHRFPAMQEGHNLILRGIRYISVHIKQYRRGIKAENIELVFAASTPPTQGILCSMVKKKLSKIYNRNVPFVYCLQDVFPDSLVNAKITREGSAIWKIGRRIENYIYKNADRIIVIGEGIKQNILNKGVPEEKIEVIPNWIDQIRNNQPITITDPTMTRFIMSLEEAVDLVLFAFEHGNTGDIFVQKAPACTIQTQAEAVCELFGGSKEKIKIIGIRHGEKMFETLLTNEECAKAEDLGEFYRVPADQRSLNYDKYFSEGNIERNSLTEFNSHNTELLTVEQVKQKLLKLSYIQDELKRL